MELETIGFCGSAAVVEEGSGGWAGSGGGGAGLEELRSVDEVVVEVAMVSPERGVCVEGSGSVPAEEGGFFGPGRMVLSRL